MDERKYQNETEMEGILAPTITFSPVQILVSALPELSHAPRPPLYHRLTLSMRSPCVLPARTYTIRRSKRFNPNAQNTVYARQVPAVYGSQSLRNIEKGLKANQKEREQNLCPIGWMDYAHCCRPASLLWQRELVPNRQFNTAIYTYEA